MLEDKVIKEIISAVGQDKVFTEPEDLTCYACDVSTYVARPDLVVRVEKEADVKAVLKIANKEKIAVVPRGAATNNCGGAVPIEGGIILDMVAMDKIIEVDKENLIAVCEPGVITGVLQSEVEKIGLFYPPDPQGLNMSTIGGNVALDAGGPRAVKYGVTRDYVMGLETVLASGEVIRTGGKIVKDVSGYNLTQLLVGSEGTLGVVTKVILKLVPLPEAKRTMMCVFDELDHAAVAVTKILDHNIVPSMLELLDKSSIRLIQDYMDAGYPTDAEAILLIEVDGSKSDVDQQITMIKNICGESQARETTVARTEAEETAIWAGRKSGFAALAAYKPVVLPEDCTVPRNKLPEMIRKVQEIAKKYNVLLPTFGHAGDGNAHPHICYDPRIPEEVEKAKKLKDEIYHEALKLGGTITGEHGVGIVKKHLLKFQHGETNLQLMAGIKQLFDPNNILNPGKSI